MCFEKTILYLQIHKIPLKKRQSTDTLLQAATLLVQCVQNLESGLYAQ